MKRLLLCIILVVASASAQMASLVTQCDAFDATAFSNGHKIASQNGDYQSDTLHIVFHSTDSVYYTYSYNGGDSWSVPTALSHGTYPAIDIDIYGFRHVVWQCWDSLYNSNDIYYDCLDDYSPPLNVSETYYNSILPDVVVDSNMVAHVVWEELAGGATSTIYYRSCNAGVLSDTFLVSDAGTDEALYTYPSVSICENSSQIYVVWDCYDPGSYSPYQIHTRYKEGNVWSSVDVTAHYLPMRHSSIDFSHGSDALSYCYEDSSSGNMEVTFVGGNGGGYSTPGVSTCPVISTVGVIWSYLFWQEEEDGYEDICYHLYYFMTGWSNQFSLRQSFNIQEQVRYPNVCGAYLIWTQGSSPPFSIYFYDFGYPIGVAEVRGVEENPILHITPNPFTTMTNVIVNTGQSAEHIGLSIYDATGRVVKNLPTPYSLHPTIFMWNGTDMIGNDVPAGTYFCVVRQHNTCAIEKLIKIR